MNTYALVKAIGIMIVFTLGFFASTIYAHITVEQPLTLSTVQSDTQTDEVASPSDWIEEKQILVYSKQVIIDMTDAEWASFTDTHSMEPVLSARANAIQIIPKSMDQIKVGDIVSYESAYASGIIIHRVIEKGEDGEGPYLIVKGDNNPYADPGKIRFSQIKRVVVAIVY